MYKLAIYGGCIRSLRFLLFPILMPAMPAIAIALSVPDNSVKLMIVMLNVGILFSRLFTTIIGNMLKSKSFILTLLVIYIMGGIIGIAPHLSAILVAGLFLGLGSGAMVSLSSVLARQSNPNHISESISLVGFIAFASRAIAVVISGYVVEFLGWQSIWAILVVLAFLLFVYTIFKKLPSTNTAGTKHDIWKSLYALIKNRHYLSIISIYGLYVSSVSVFSIVTPFLVVRHFHLSLHQFAYFLLPSYITAALGQFFCMRYGKRLAPSLYYTIVYMSFLFGIVLLFIATVTVQHFTSLFIISSGIALCYWATGLITPYMQTHIVINFSNQMLPASAGMGLMCSFICIIVSLIAPIVNDTTSLALAVFQLIIFCGALGGLWISRSKLSSLT